MRVKVSVSERCEVMASWERMKTHINALSAQGERLERHGIWYGVKKTVFEKEWKENSFVLC
jgi:hypothetical protein